MMADEDNKMVGKLVLTASLSGFGIGLALFALGILLNPDIFTKTRAGIILGVAGVITTAGVLKTTQYTDKLDELL